ncbi:hypothetical protein LCGC14_1792240 [marine sediment metagenome]|uniref:Uncharacterized protein n=1 Tax=marine sediment metagenome TaxID=412755 RepID=A0A0F9HES0_9ZZZZ
MALKNNNCVICGKPKKSQLHPMCIECSPYLYKKGSFPHQKLRRRKVWLEKRREALIKVGKKCEWCENDQQNLAIHHPKEVNSRTYEHIWNQLLINEINSFLISNREKTLWAENYFKKETKKALRSSIRHFEQRAKNSMTMGCPFCAGSNYSVRKIMTPKYKCNGCKSTFNDLKPRPRREVKDKISSLKSQLKNEDYSKMRISGYNRQKIFGKFSGELLPKFYQKLKLEYEKKVSGLLDDYLEMKNIKVLCIKCHSAVRLGLKFCKRCKTNYRKGRYKMCYKCHIAEKESKDPLAIRIREIFGISKQELWERNMEGECIVCGAWAFERVSNFSEYNVHLLEKDGASGECVGELCEDCYKRYNKTEVKSFIVEISN